MNKYEYSTSEYTYEIERKFYSFEEMLESDNNKKRWQLKLLENNVEISSEFFENYESAEDSGIRWVYKNELPY